MFASELYLVEGLGSTGALLSVSVFSCLSLASGIPGFLCVHEALQAILPGAQLRPRRHADAAFPPAFGQGRGVLRPRVLQRGPAQCHGRVRRHPGRHGSRQPALRRGRADKHARRLLRLHPPAHQGEKEGMGWDGMREKGCLSCIQMFVSRGSCFFLLFSRVFSFFVLFCILSSVSVDG